LSLASFLSALDAGAPVAGHALVVHPLFRAAVADPPVPVHDVLADALAAGSFVVEEISPAGDVPRLRARNSGDRAVFLLDGEELVGAKQDRVLNLSLLLPAGSDVEIPVSCVEPGRWRHVSARFGSAGRAQFARGRSRKLDQVSRSLGAGRGMSADQRDVWSEIGAKAARMGASSPTGAMSAVFERHDRAVDGIVSSLPWREHQVGAVFSIGGRVAGLEAFGSARTCGRLWDGVVRSYAIDALEAPPAAVGEATDAEGFLRLVSAAPAAVFPAVGEGSTRRLSGDGVTGAALEAEGAVVHVVAFPCEAAAG